VLLNVLQFDKDIGDGYREIQETGFTVEICRPWPECPGLEMERIYVRGLEIIYLLMYFWTPDQDPDNPVKVSNQAVQRDPTAVSQTLRNLRASHTLGWSE